MMYRPQSHRAISHPLTQYSAAIDDPRLQLLPLVYHLVNRLMLIGCARLHI